MSRFATWLVVCLLLATSAATAPHARAESLQLKKGARISIVGNTLAERLQHDGWLETMIQNRFPENQTTVRNLGFSADALTEQLRVEGFGSQDDWLTRTKADVVFAFFGFDESFAGEAGVAKFKSDLTNYINNVRNHKYNGETSPTLVLFSPIAAENPRNRNLPDGVALNKQIKLYVDAMAEVAKANNVAYVDVFTPTLAAFAKAGGPYTDNGIHLSTSGNKLLAQIIDAALFDGKAPQRDDHAMEALRAAVVDKNFYWFHRYQTTDGYNVHGGRSSLNYNGITNRMVMDREMEVLEVMTANRDKAVWAAANGEAIKIDDSNTPPFIDVPTNAPGAGPNGTHIFLSGEEAISKMTLGKNLKVNLFASEEKFPELVNPVQMAFDTKGRLFVCAWPNYPHWKPKDDMNDKLLILIDEDGDGKADKCKVFADHLHNPTGFEFWGGGVFVAMAPDILFLKDTDGDDVADVRIKVIQGISSGDTHHTANSFVLDPGGALYFQEGVFHRTQIETPYGPVRNSDGCLWRYEPRTGIVERYAPYGYANPHGHVFDRWGQGYSIDGTGAEPYHDTVYSGHLDYPARRGGAPKLYQRRTRPCPGAEILSSSHFPPEMQGNLLVENVIGDQAILQYHLEPKDSSYAGTEIEPLIKSTDRNFRPVDLEIAPDGSLYFTDWQNPIIGHMQHHIRDPSRDHTHGRVYRITYEGRPLLAPPKIAGEPIEKLLELLKSPEDRVRYRTRIELSARDSDEVISAVTQWIKKLDVKDANYEHNMLEALWLHQSHNMVDEALLKRELRSPELRARAAATRVLGYWGDRVSNPLDLLAVQATDDAPLVRLEAVRAASFFRDAKAAEIALSATSKPMDEYLKYTLNETLKQLRQFQK